jgi:[ribosomal protein S5]-alanine N-acetyltransferase
MLELRRTDAALITMPIRLPEPIQTSRLTLRLVEPSDVDALFEIHHDTAATRYIPHMYWRERADALAWVERGIDRHEKQTAIQCAVVRRATRETPEAVIGTALVFNVQEDSGLAEIGYVLGAPYWRQGYMVEALTALIECAFTTVGLRRLEAMIDARNAPSNALATRCGFVLEGVLRERWVAAGETPDTHVMGLLRRDWQALKQV